MTKTIEDLFYYGVYVSDFAVLLGILILFQKKALPTFIVVLLIYSSSNLVCNILTEIFPANYQLITRFQTIIEYSAFAAIFYLFLNNSKKKNFLKIFSLAFLAIEAGLFFVSKSVRLDSLSIGIETILIFVYAIWYFYEQMSEVTNAFIYMKASFWVVIGILFYLAGSFFFNIFANQVERSFIDQYWFFTYIFYIIKNIFFIIALFMHDRQQKADRMQHFQPLYN